MKVIPRSFSRRRPCTSKCGTSRTSNPIANNPRLNDAAVDAVAASIRQFGFRQPIVVDEDGVIIVGHTRYKAALKLGPGEGAGPRRQGLTPAQIKAYRIADNQTAELSTWDYDLLPMELAGLQEAGLRPRPARLRSATSWRGCSSRTPATGLTDPDDVPEPPDEAITQPGDLWLLGDHRLLCGDSSKPEDVDRLLDGAADPSGQHRPAVQREGRAAQQQRHRRRPVSRSPAPRTTSSSTSQRHPEKSKPTTKKLRAKDRPLANDFVSDEEFDRLLHAWFGNMARVLRPGRGFYIWGGYANCAQLPAGPEERTACTSPRRSSGTSSIRC